MIEITIGIIIGLLIALVIMIVEIKIGGTGAIAGKVARKLEMSINPRKGSVIMPKSPEQEAFERVTKINEELGVDTQLDDIFK
jgi:hypothetical protein